jgi:hypothetical protein
MTITIPAEFQADEKVWTVQLRLTVKEQRVNETAEAVAYTFSDPELAGAAPPDNKYSVRFSYKSNQYTERMRVERGQLLGGH